MRAEGVGGRCRRWSAKLVVVMAWVRVVTGEQGMGDGDGRRTAGWAPLFALRGDGVVGRRCWRGVVLGHQAVVCSSLSLAAIDAEMNGDDEADG
ncbi:hypothetical protein Dimus_022846 [Dionaea muscipula]